MTSIETTSDLSAMRERISDGNSCRLTLARGTTALRFGDVVDAWISNEAFRYSFIQLLADTPFQAFFWEMPPLTQTMLVKEFECVFVDSPALAGVRPNAKAFSDYFKSAGVGAAVAGFPSLGRDAYLVAPCPQGESKFYPHLAAFSRAAPATQQQAFWQYTGVAVKERLSDQPLWLSTSGLGVYWLHVRLDSIPKYYTYEPYTKFP